MAIEVLRRHGDPCCLILALCAIPGCGSRTRNLSNRTEEEPPLLASVVRIADPAAATQLVSGFYGVEQNTWRWTARRFAVLLRPPPGAALNGALLKLDFRVPDVVMAQLRSVTLSASIQEMLLAPETYTKPGESLYAREVPAGLLSGDSVRADFAPDKALPLGPGDRRELGAIVTRIALEAK